MSSINQTFINYNAPEIIPEINVFTLNVGTQNVNTLNVTGTLTAPNFDLGASDVTVQNLDVTGNVNVDGELIVGEFYLSETALIINSIDCTGSEHVGNTTVNNDLSVSGNSQLANLTNTNTVTIAENVTVVNSDNLLDVTIDSVITSDSVNVSDVDVDGTVNFSGTLICNDLITNTITASSLTLNKNLIVLTNGGSYTPQLVTQLGYCGNVQLGANSSQTFPNTNYGIDASPLFQTISDALIITVPGTYLLTAQANLVPVNSSDVASYGIAICTTSSTSNANTFCKEVFPNYNDTDNNPTLWGSLQGPSLLCSGLNTFTTVPQSLYIGISCNPNTAVGLQAVGYTLKLQAMKIV